MSLKDMITDKLSDAIAISMQAKETIGEEKDKLEDKRKLKKEQKEEKKRLEEEFRKKEEAKELKKTLKWAVPTAIVFIALFGIMSMFEDEGPKAQAQETTKPENTAVNPTTPSTTQDGELKVSYIDVGQGDSIFIELPNGDSMLIDAGNTSNGTEIINYIHDEGYSEIDYLIATHPHSDHIGGMPQVVENLDIGKIYMPKVSHTTIVYDNLLTAIDNKGLKINAATAGINIINQGNLRVDILAPVSDSYSDLNNYSAVIKIVYGDSSFLFMGDAEKLSEVQISTDLDADVLKVGHHGSDYSSGQAFLNLVSPDYSIISVGEGNQYDHPSSETIIALLGLDSKVYRTDLDGTIVFVSNGTRITVSKSPATTAVVVPPTQQETPSVQQEPAPIQPSTSNATVYITDNGTKYHSSGCSYLRSSCHAVTLQQAKDAYLTPCSKCDPPQ